MMSRLKHIAFLSVLNFMAVAGHCQPEYPRTIDSVDYVVKLDTLTSLYGKNKRMAGDLKLCFLIALSYYPELSQTKIFFRYAPIKTTLNTTPGFFSTIFSHKLKRKNIIRINNSKKPNKVLIDQADFNSKIGIMGHELAHIYDYNQTNTPGIIYKAVTYLTAKGRRKLEQNTDKMVVQKGLGWQLYDWSNFVLEKSCATEKYKSFKRDIYLSPDQIVEEMTLKEDQLNLLHISENQ